MAVPIHFLINSPHESSDDEFNLSEISYSSDDDESMEEVESSELVNTNAGSLSSPLSNLEHDEETEANGGGSEDEFWVKYSYLKELVEIIVSQGLISEDDAFERVKLIGDDKAKELNDGWKALCIKEQDLGNEMLDLLASTMK